MQWFVLQYAQVALGLEWPTFFFRFTVIKFTHAQNINIMYKLDSARQKFEVLIGVVFLSDNS